MGRGALALGLIGAAFAAATPACAQSQASASAAVSVVQVFTISRTQTLEFGKLKGGNVAQGPGTFTVNTFGAVSVTGGAAAIASVTPHAAEFTLSGQAGRAYHVNLPVAPVTVPELAGGLSLLASAFNARTLSGGPGVLGNLDGSGADTVFVGATLAVPVGANPGIYTLALVLTADYD